MYKLYLFLDTLPTIMKQTSLQQSEASQLLTLIPLYIDVICK